MKLQGKRVAALVTDGFEQVELTSPKQALEEQGARVDIVSPNDGTVKGWDHTQWGEEFNVDVQLEDANPADYDALLLPGGVMNPDKLRTIPAAVQFAKSFFDSGKPVGSICHGPWLLVEADVVKGYNVTAYKSLKTDLTNAGAKFHDKEAVIDRGLVTSRNPGDLPAFNQAIIEEFAEGRHGGDGQRRPAREAAASRSR